MFSPLIPCIPLSLFVHSLGQDICINWFSHWSTKIWKSIITLEIRCIKWIISFKRYPPDCGLFTKEVNRGLAKRLLLFKGRLANRRLYSLVKGATVGVFQAFKHCVFEVFGDLNQPPLSICVFVPFGKNLERMVCYATKMENCVSSFHYFYKKYIQLIIPQSFVMHEFWVSPLNCESLQ